MDREEFISFYAASFPRLVGQLYAMTGDRAEAQDAVQEAFVRAWVHRGQLGTGRGAEAWVRVTAWRIAASRWRRAQEGVRLMVLAARPDRAAGPGPDRVAFVEALRRVPAEQRRALVLFHLVDLTVEQIAAETGVRPGTVKARLARGRAALTPYLRDTAPVKTGRLPQAIAITPDGKTAYVGNNTSGTVTPIRTATNTALPPVKTGGNPFAIAITPNGKTAYVSLVTAGVTPIRTTTNTALPGLKIGYSGPIAITP